MSSPLVLFIDKSVFENKYVWDDCTKDMPEVVSEVLAKEFDSLRAFPSQCVCFVDGIEFDRIKKKNHDLYRYGHLKSDVPVYIRKLIKRDWVQIAGLYFIEEC